MSSQESESRGVGSLGLFCLGGATADHPVAKNLDSLILLLAPMLQRITGSIIYPFFLFSLGTNACMHIGVRWCHCLAWFRDAPML